MKISVFVSVFVILITTLASAEENVIIMGYNAKNKIPLIGDENDNSGLYKELFETAAKKIGYRLKIVRLPKKRVHMGFKEGTLDFYPGASFSEKRSKCLYFQANGLEKKEVLLSARGKDEITDLSKLNGRCAPPTLHFHDSL